MRTLGIDLGATTMKRVLLDSSPDGSAPLVTALDPIPTRGDEGHDEVIGRLIESVGLTTASHGPFDAFGLGTPGLFDDNGIVTLFTNLPGQWIGVDLRTRLEGAVDIPVAMINDARAFTLAEGRVGAGRGRSPLVCMTLGTGIGGGVMIDGKLHEGATGIAGEIAHQTVLPDGPRCGCGNPGCAEVMARSDVLAAAAGKDTVAQVFAGIRDGDPRCVEAVETAAGYLGIALANAVTLLGPERIVIGGGIVAAGDLILDPIRRATRRRATLVDDALIDIVPAELGPEAGAIGAALAALDMTSVA